MVGKSFKVGDYYVIVSPKVVECEEVYQLVPYIDDIQVTEIIDGDEVTRSVYADLSYDAKYDLAEEIFDRVNIYLATGGANASSR